MAPGNISGQWDDHVEIALADLHSRGLLRYLRPVSPTVNAVKVRRSKFCKFTNGKDEDCDAPSLVSTAAFASLWLIHLIWMSSLVSEYYPGKAFE